MANNTKRTWIRIAALAGVLVTAPAVPLLHSSPASATPGSDLDHYLHVAKSAWLMPLGLSQKLVSVGTDFRADSGLNDVGLAVLSDDGMCDPSQPKFWLRTQLMLYHGMKLRCWEYNEPGNAAVPSEKVTARINAVVEWLKSELHLTATPLRATAEERGYALSGDRLSGEVWFDQAKGYLSSLDLEPRQP